MNIINGLFILSNLVLSAFAPLKTEKVSRFNQLPMKSEIILRDLNGNNFILEEMENSYAIYQKSGENLFFIEGSNSVNSPYFGKNYDNLIYLGPGNYYVFENDTLTNLLTEETLKTNGRKLNYNPASKINSNNAEKRVANAEQKYIKYADYIKQLKDVPSNTEGDCGIIALSILLSYYDSCIDDRFLDDSDFAPTKTIDIGEVPNISDYSQTPMISNSFRTSFKNEYSVCNTFIQFFSGGYPMADAELYTTIDNYLNSQNSDIKNDYYFDHQTVFNLDIVTKVYDYIRDDVPVVMVLANYTDDKGYHDGEWHDVVAYGIKNDHLVVHLGYDNRSEIELSTIGLYGFYAMNPLKEHTHHSENMKFVHNGKNYGMCGCGIYNII